MTKPGAPQGPARLLTAKLKGAETWAHFWSDIEGPVPKGSSFLEISKCGGCSGPLRVFVFVKEPTLGLFCIECDTFRGMFQLVREEQ